MIRSFAFASIAAVAFAAPVLANDQAADAVDPAAVKAYTAQLSNAANEQQVRKLLNVQGYSQISPLTRDENGRWTGTAVKNGKPVGVAIALPAKPAAAPATN